jgi:hypothetical protein
MVGFGLMDNIIIQAGDIIDHTLEVRFGFLTLFAAAFGNLSSDASGVLFSSVVKLAAAWLYLKLPNMPAAQAGMAAMRRAATLGQLFRIMCGCSLGMRTLLFMDMEGAEHLKMAKKLDTVFEPVLNSVHLLVKAERCTLYLFDEDKGKLWTRAASGSGDATRIIKLSINSNSLAATAARTRKLLNVFDARSDARHDGSWDAKTGYVMRSVLSVPILHEHGGKLYRCLQVINKVGGASDDAGFSVEDEHLLTMVSNHTSIFVQAVMNE